MSGWIKLHRQIVSSSKFADPDILRLWILCLTKATHKDTVAVIDRQEIPLTPGQFVTGRYSLSEDYNAVLAPRKKIKDTTLWSWLQRLEKWGDLDIKSTNKYSVVTVLKWSEYQETLTTELQQTDNRLTTELQQFDTNKNVEKVKNVKKDKKELKTIYAEQVSLTEPEYQKLIEKYGTEEHVKAAIEKLSNYKCSKKTKYTSDYHVLIGWVYDDFKKKNLTVVNGGVNNGSTQSNLRQGHGQHGGSDQGVKAYGNASTGTGTEQRESKIRKGRWDDAPISLPNVQG